MAPQQEGIGSTPGTFPSPLPPPFFPGNSAPPKKHDFLSLMYKLPKRQSPSSWEGHWWDKICVPCQVPERAEKPGETMQTLQKFLLTPGENSAGSVRGVSEKLSSHVFRMVARAECTLLLLEHTELQAVEDIHA